MADIDPLALLPDQPRDGRSITPVLLADAYSIAGERHGLFVVLAPDFRDPSHLATVARPVQASDYTGGDGSDGDAQQWTLTFADDVPGNSSQLITRAYRRFTLVPPSTD